MLEEFLENEIFVNLMKVHVNETVDLLLQEEMGFNILAGLDGVSFEPELPENVLKTFKPIISFNLQNYTLESAMVNEDYLQFEAGFGAENIGSLVSVRLDKILQIVVEGTPILINLSISKSNEEIIEKEEEEEGLEKSMNAFLSNPENDKFFKK